MPSALSVIGAITLMAIGAGGMYQYDRHSPIGWHAHVLFWDPGIDLPPSLQDQRDQAIAALAKINQSNASCQAALTVQNIAANELAAQSSDAKAAVERELAGQRSTIAALRQASSRISHFVPTGASACDRWESVDAFILKQLGQP